MQAGQLLRYGVAGLRPRKRGTFISACAQHRSRLLYLDNTVGQLASRHLRPSGEVLFALGSVCTFEPLIESFLAIGALLDPPQAFREIPDRLPLIRYDERIWLGVPFDEQVRA